MVYEALHNEKPFWHGVERSARILSPLLKTLGTHMYPGQNAHAIERICLDYLKNSYGSSSLYGFQNFQGHICVNRNEIAAHCPPGDMVFKPGDLITVDIVIDVLGWKADLAWTYGIEPLQPEHKKLLNTAWQASLIPLCARNDSSGKSAGRLLSQLVDQKQFQVCDRFAGHGIGREIHLPPLIAYQAELCRFPHITADLPAFCWEPIITQGNRSVERLRSGAYQTIDGKFTAQFEHMYTISPEGQLLLINLDYSDIYVSPAHERLLSSPPW